MSGPFKMGGTALYGKPTKKGVEQADPSQELKPPTPAFSREADPLAKDGEPTTRTSRNLVKNDGSVNTVAKYTDSPAKQGRKLSDVGEGFSIIGQTLARPFVKAAKGAKKVAKKVVKKVKSKINKK